MCSNVEISGADGGIETRNKRQETRPQWSL